MRLDVPDTYYFDEVYHAFTAQAYSQNDPRGYEWWHTAPQGFAYEWLHPPLAKLIQAGSIWIFGDKPFWWRFPGVIFGTATGVLLYALGKRFFGRVVGLFALIFWTFDGLSFTASRITMNDIFLTFWVVLAFYLFLSKKPAWQIAFVAGLALATKWSGFFAVGILAVLWIVLRVKDKGSLREIIKGSVAFLVIPPLVYVVSYTQFFLQGHTLAQFYELHQQIWWYQNNLTATHPYSSVPLEWLFMMRPLYAFTQSVDDKVANIYLMGNPFLFWGGLAASIWVFANLMIKRLKHRLEGEDITLGIILLGYLGMFIPWAFSPRIMFFYHYLPALPFMFLLLAWVLGRMWESGNRLLVIGYLSLVLLVFIFYYPHWSAFPVPQSIDKFYYWFSSWR